MAGETSNASPTKAARASREIMDNVVYRFPLAAKLKPTTLDELLPIFGTQHTGAVRNITDERQAQSSVENQNDNVCFNFGCTSLRCSNSGEHKLKFCERQAELANIAL